MKYELTDTKKYGLYQIRALKDFGDVKAGDLGGWIESEANLSQDGNCWVYDDAEVYGSARVYGNARVFDNAWVYGNAEVYGSARVYGNAEVSGNAYVYGNAEVFGDAEVYGNARVYGNAVVEPCEPECNHIKGNPYCPLCGEKL